LQGSPFGAYDAAVAIVGYGTVVLAALCAGVVIGRRYHGRIPVRVSTVDKEEMLQVESASDFRYNPESIEFSESQFCPVCRAEYIAGTTACEDCGVDLVEEPDVPEFAPRINERLIRIPNVTNVINAQLLRQYLFAYRIPSLLVRNSIADILESDLYVFESDALRARKIIVQFLSETSRLRAV
jgi:hypothetical protein